MGGGTSGGAPALPRGTTSPTSMTTGSAIAGTTAGGTATDATAGPLTALTFTASAAAIVNPERGFYNWVDIMNNPDFGPVRAAGNSLAFGLIRLDPYRAAALPQSLLNQLSAGLALTRAAHVKVILCFAYNYPGTAPDGSATQDAPLSTIQQHAAQLQSVLAANVDVIAAVQAGFIGEWAEWHDSTHGLDNAASRLAVMNAVLQAVPASRYVLIRYPYEKRENWLGPLQVGEAFGTSARARIGHHNDCFLDGDDDAGTYHAAEDKTYLAADSFWVPEGGETCALAAPRTDCPTATLELATYHWVFLNADFDKDVLNRWTPCMPEVVNRLGYRLTLQDASLNLSTSASSGTLDLTIHLNNSGYARMMNARPVNIVLTGSSGRKVYALTGVDPRRWDPGVTSTLQTSLNLGALDAGTYAISIWLPDAAPALAAIADYAVQFANVETWDSAHGDNVLTRNFVVH